MEKKAFDVHFMPLGYTVKEEIFVGEKFRTFPYKTFRTDFEFVLLGWPDPLVPERLRVGGLPLGTEENLVWNLISYFFQSYESYEIKAGPPPWFEFLVIFDFFAPWYRKSREASSVKIL